MPSMPKWLGDMSEKFFKSSYRETVISEVEYYHKQFKRVRYQGEALKGIEWLAAQEIEFRINDTDYRHYTPSAWNAQKGYVDVLFYLHGKGVGSIWADSLKEGDEVLLIGPGGKFVVKPEEKNIVMMGDETTIGAFYGMQQAIANDVKMTCILEMNADGLDWHKKIGLDNTVVLEKQSGQRGKVQYQWLDNYIETSHDYKNNTYYLSGNADTIKKLRRKLILSGVNSKAIYPKPYWREGKKGL